MKREPISIILENRKFGWTQHEMSEFKGLWKAYSTHTDDTIMKVKQIAIDMEEDVNDVFLLCLDLSLKGEI